MLVKRIAPCLDIKDRETVRGINPMNFRDAGDPVELDAQCSRERVDELVYLNTIASHEGRKTFTGLVKQVVTHVDIPSTMSGDINELRGVDRLLNAGAGKISISSAALRNPTLIEEIVKSFGSQVCAAAISTNFENNDWLCYLNGGHIPADKYLFQWALGMKGRDADEVPFTSIARDGTKNGYANDALATLADTPHIPVITSSGAGEVEHSRGTFSNGKTNAALVAGVSYSSEIRISDLKQYLKGKGTSVRM